MMVVRWTEFGAWQRSMHDDQLLSEHHVLGGQGGPAAEQRSEERPDQSQDAHFHASILGHMAGILRWRVSFGKNGKSCGIKADGTFGMERTAYLRANV